MAPNNEDYFFGRVDAEIKNNNQTLSELKEEIKEIKKLILDLSNWKYKITGLASGASIVITLIANMIIKKVF